MNNEKIKNLAELCIDKETGTFNVGAYTQILLDECLDILSKVGSPHASTTFDIAQHQGSMLQAKVAIKNNFGLE
jgi:hypothetical protein